MAERPILFSGPLVRAILDGRKTETRRLVTRGTSRVGRGKFEDLDLSAAYRPDVHHPLESTNADLEVPRGLGTSRIYARISTDYVLYVRESYAPRYFDDGSHAYAADWTGAAADLVTEPKWTPSIHMPEAAARISLRVTEVLAERLQEIDEAGAQAEGFAHEPCPSGLRVSSRAQFQLIWDSIYSGEQAWAADPWVWRIKFEVIS